MLMFVFGAGASFDSDPLRRPGDPATVGTYEEDFRPPLAMGLFTPPSGPGKSIVGEFPRAAPLIMRLRQAVERGEDVEEVMEAFSAAGDSYPAVAAQMLSFRGYLARLMATIPDEWADACQGLTNYVLALSEADRWNSEATHAEGRSPVGCVTFNYDALLEEAVRRAFGHSIDDLDDFTSSADVHVFKPHGSVTWRQAAHWSVPDSYLLPGDAALHRAIQDASSLTWLDEWKQTDPESTTDDYQDRSDPTKVWLPALSVPVRRKSTFTMPAAHKAALIADLGKVTTVVAVGWRARERHFLQLLQDAMPSRPARLVAVAETDDAARETVENLWTTGKFQAYAISGNGFSGFTESPPDHLNVGGSANHTALTLTEVLSSAYGSMVWTNRQAGRGLAPESLGESDYVKRPWADI